MKTKLLSTLLVTASLTWSVSSSAGTIGTLSWDGTSKYIEDSASSTRYIQLGLLSGLTYAQTLAETAPDGDAAGFHIASKTEAYSFYNAMYDGQDIVDDVDPFQFYLRFAAFDDGALGYNFNADLDIAYFLTDVLDDGLGLVRLNNRRNRLEFYEGWTDITNNDTQIASAADVDFGWTFLMVSDDINVSAVPIPAAAFMFAPALLGFAALRRKKSA